MIPMIESPHNDDNQHNHHYDDDTVRHEIGVSCLKLAIQCYHISKYEKTMTWADAKTQLTLQHGVWTPTQTETLAPEYVPS